MTGVFFFVRCYFFGEGVDWFVIVLDDSGKFGIGIGIDIAFSGIDSGAHESSFSRSRSDAISGILLPERDWQIVRAEILRYNTKSSRHIGMAPDCQSARSH